MADDVEKLEKPLSEFKGKFGQLSDVDDPPQTLLHILRRESKETYWNKILSYFLDPTGSHGFGTDLLEEFLSMLALNSDLNFNFDRLDFGDLEVKSEWVVRDLEVRPDITIYSGTSWFVCLEMKVGSVEGDDQTENYVGSEYIGNVRKKEFGEENDRKGHHYVYLVPSAARNASADPFVDIAWRDVIESLERFERQSHGR